jgi:hypothetical protein
MNQSARGQTIALDLNLKLKPLVYRLDLQNEVFRKALGNSIVFAPIKLHAGDKVLDSGTGSGL